LDDRDEGDHSLQLAVFNLEKIMKTKMKKQSGFTLLEVMVVVVILGILASFVVPNLLGNKEKADQQKAITDIVALENALDMYKLDNSVYPTTDQGLDALVSKPTSSPEPRNYRDGGYIKRLPNDPWGNEYQYLSPGDNGTIDIFTLGVDGQEGGEGIAADVGNWNIQDFQ
jgi:general secretion pathway protein G